MSLYNLSLTYDGRGELAAKLDGLAGSIAELVVRRFEEAEPADDAANPNRWPVELLSLLADQLWDDIAASTVFTCSRLVATKIATREGMRDELITVGESVVEQIAVDLRKGKTMSDDYLLLAYVKSIRTLTRQGVSAESACRSLMRLATLAFVQEGEWTS
jgi:hypothetical protein